MVNSKESPGRQTHYLTAAVFASVLIHAFLAYLLWIVVSDRIVFKPDVPAEDSPLILSLATFTPDSPGDIDLEDISEEPPDKLSQPIQEPTSDEAAVTSISRATPDSEALEDNDTTPSLDMDNIYRMDLDFGIMQKLEAEPLMSLENHGNTGSKAHKSGSSSFDLDTVYRMARDGSWMTESQVHNQRIELRVRHLARHREWLPKDCWTAYSRFGLLAIPALIKNAINPSGCEWNPSIKIGKKPVYIIDNRTEDTFKTLLPVNVSDNRIIFNITKEGEIWVMGKKVNLNAIQGIMETFKNEYPDGSVVITCDRDSRYKTAMDVLDQIEAAKIDMVVMINL